MRSLFNQRCTVFRIKETLDEFKTPVDESLQKAGVYRCMVTRKTSTAAQSDPNTEMSESLMLYAPVRSDIQEGDVVEVGGLKYSAGTPYRPKNHHLEVELMREGDV